MLGSGVGKWGRERSRGEEFGVKEGREREEGVGEEGCGEGGERQGAWGQVSEGREDREWRGVGRESEGGE